MANWKEVVGNAEPDVQKVQMVDNFVYIYPLSNVILAKKF